MPPCKLHWEAGSRQLEVGSRQLEVGSFSFAALQQAMKNPRLAGHDWCEVVLPGDR